jgi:ubiquinone/menaquinone biosynthesis C-methylase UbiE
MMTMPAIGELLGPRFEVVAADVALALERLQLSAGARALDVGTGSGNCAIFLAARGCEVVTGEPADDRSFYAGRPWEESARRAGVADRIRFQAFDASALPFEDASFEAVFCFGMLHHVAEEQRGAVMAETLRVVKRNGSVVVFEPDDEMLRIVRSDDPGHPDAAEPSRYVTNRQAEAGRIDGTRMRIYFFRKQ